MLTLTSLTIWLRWEQAGSGGMITLISLTIWLRWEQAVSGRSDFAGCKLVAVDPALQVGVKLASLVAVNLASLVGVKLASLVAVDLALLGGSWEQ